MKNNNNQIEQPVGINGMMLKIMKFIDAVKTGFVSDAGVTGFKGVLSRIKNLWNSGSEGKAFILAMGFVFILMFSNESPLNNPMSLPYEEGENVSLQEENEKCLSVNCPPNFEKEREETQYNLNKCSKFALDLSSKTSLTSPKVISTKKIGPYYLNCLVSYIKPSYGGTELKYYGIAANLENGAYEYEDLR